MSKYQMPAGEYYFGDPCYVIRASWMELLESTNFLEDFSNTKWNTRAGSTAYGDGSYTGMELMANIEFAVDAGVIGLVPSNEMEVPANTVDTLGTTFVMDHPFQFEAIDGRFYINDVLVLDTNTWDDEEEEEDDDYYDSQYDDDEEDY